jgi:hypothetical protein
MQAAVAGEHSTEKAFLAESECLSSSKQHPLLDLCGFRSIVNTRIGAS